MYLTIVKKATQTWIGLNENLDLLGLSDCYWNLTEHSRFVNLGAFNLSLTEKSQMLKMCERLTANGYTIKINAMSPRG